MKLSTRTRYGLRALLEVAENYNQGPLRLKTIAEKQDLSVKYLEQLMAMLKAAGFVRSIRGSKGGYILARPANLIKISDVFRSLEGPVITVDCLQDSEYCPRSTDCAARKLWEDVEQAINNVLKNTTLQDLIDRGRGDKILQYQI